MKDINNAAYRTVPAMVERSEINMTSVCEKLMERSCFGSAIRMTQSIDGIPIDTRRLQGKQYVLSLPQNEAISLLKLNLSSTHESPNGIKIPIYSENSAYPYELDSEMDMELYGHVSLCENLSIGVAILYGLDITIDLVDETGMVYGTKYAIIDKDEIDHDEDCNWGVPMGFVACCFAETPILITVQITIYNELINSNPAVKKALLNNAQLYAVVHCRNLAIASSQTSSVFDNFEKVVCSNCRCKGCKYYNTCDDQPCASILILHDDLPYVMSQSIQMKGPIAGYNKNCRREWNK